MERVFRAGGYDAILRAETLEEAVAGSRADRTAMARPCCSVRRARVSICFGILKRAARRFAGPSQYTSVRRKRVVRPQTVRLRLPVDALLFGTMLALIVIGLLMVVDFELCQDARQPPRGA